MEEKGHHEGLVDGFRQQLNEVFDSSGQAVYLYLDDEHKACNGRFASLLGYGSPGEWAAEGKAFIDFHVDDKSRAALVSAYRDAMEKVIALQFPVTWKRKDGQQVRTKVILVPISFSGHMFALHFISNA
jgi:PAS domain-containing protein